MGNQLISVEAFQKLDSGLQTLELEHIETLIEYTHRAEIQTKLEIMRDQRRRLEEHYSLLCFVIREK